MYNIIEKWNTVAGMVNYDHQFESNTKSLH